jgi:tetratricopeptide (TPR) repeat protein
MHFTSTAQWVVAILLMCPMTGAYAAAPQDWAIACFEGTGSFDIDQMLCRRAAGAAVFAGRYSDALKDSELAIESNPQSALAHYEKGRALRHLSQFAQSPAALGEALRVWPRFDGAYRERALSHLADNQQLAALNDLNKAVGLRPDLAPAIVWRGIARYLLSHSGALADFNTGRERAYADVYLDIWHFLATPGAERVTTRGNSSPMSGRRRFTPESLVN